MRKNGSRIISFGRYRATDLLLFAVILVAFDLISFFAFTKWFADDLSNFFFSLAIPISLIVMIRWNWYGLFYAVLDGVVYCTLLILSSDGAYDSQALQYFMTYCIGGACVGLAYLMVHFMGHERIAGHWGFTILYMLCGWVAVEAARLVINICFGASLYSAVVTFFASPSELLSLAVGAMVMLVLRKLDGMLENQRAYLLRLDRERQEKMKADTFGEAPVEIDAEALKTLNKKGDDMFGPKG